MLAPACASATAIATAADGRGVSLDAARVSGRDGITGARERGSIGFSAIRGGDIVGEHDVLFAGEGERIILRAALWGQGQKPGRYDMMDVLGL